MKKAMLVEVAEAKSKIPGMKRCFLVNLLPVRITTRERKRSVSETVSWEMEKKVILS